MQTARDVATCMYYTGIDPFTKEAVYLARQLKDRKLRRALLQFFKPENYFLVREALLQAGRSDLIGGGKGMKPRGKYVHHIPRRAGSGKGYRLGRKSINKEPRTK